MTSKVIKVWKLEYYGNSYVDKNVESLCEMIREMDIDTEYKVTCKEIEYEAHELLPEFAVFRLPFKTPLTQEKDGQFAWTTRYDGCPKCKELKAELNEALEAVGRLIDHSNYLQEEIELTINERDAYDESAKSWMKSYDEMVEKYEPKTLVLSDSEEK
jgi:hypothetical protein